MDYKGVSEIFETQRQLHSENLGVGQRKILLQRAEDLDKQIDKLVYKLYGLTREEIGIIEENIK